MNFPKRTKLWEQCVRKRPQNLAPWSFYGIPKQFHNTSLEDLDIGPSSVLARSLKLIEKSPMVWSEGYDLLITGERGVGKSHLAAEFVKEVLWYHEHSAYFIQFEDLLALLERTRFINRASQEDLDKLDGIRDCELLVIDGVHDEIDLSSTRTALGAFLRGRLGRGDRSSILTTYLSPTDLSGAFGDRLASDIKERCIWFELEGTSRRAQVNKSKLEALDD